jgi:hypothetical protein
MTNSRKGLMQVSLSGQSGLLPGLLMDVNNTGEFRDNPAWA